MNAPSDSEKTRHAAFRRMKRNGGGSADRSSGSSWKRHGTALPGWKDLEEDRNQRRKGPVGDGEGSFLQGVSTVRFALLIMTLAAAFTLYVGHVHATQRVLADLQNARAENHSLHLKHNRLKGAFDRKTGPSVIYERARALGLRESVQYGPEISLE